MVIYEYNYSLPKQTAGYINFFYLLQIPCVCVYDSLVMLKGYFVPSSYSVSNWLQTTPTVYHRQLFTICIVLGVIVFYSEEENMPRVKYAEHGRQKAEKNSWELNCCMVYLRDVTASCELTYVFLASLQRSATAVRDGTISAVHDFQLVW